MYISMMSWTIWVVLGGVISHWELPAATESHHEPPCAAGAVGCRREPRGAAAGPQGALRAAMSYREQMGVAGCRREPLGVAKSHWQPPAATGSRQEPPWSCPMWEFEKASGRWLLVVAGGSRQHQAAPSDSRSLLTVAGGSWCLLVAHV